MKKGSIKITSGTYRSRAIATPGGKTHPMGERERIALFNMISEEIPGAVVLDAFAGSGALGLEAISRGAKEVTFIESNPAASRTIKKNLASLGATGMIVTSKVSSFLSDTEYDVVLADPPYDDFKLSEVTYLVHFLKNGGIFVLSHPGEAPDISELTLTKSRKYAGATISIFVKA